MTLHLPTVARAALLGLTTGSRSFSGLAAQVAVTPSLADRQPERTLGGLRAKRLVALLAVGELVGDKLPMTPSRLAPPVLASRLALAAGTALLVARARDEEERARRGPTADEQGPAEASLPPAVRPLAVPTTAYVAVPVAVAASLASAFLGSAGRGWASKRVGRDWPGAVGEDVVALTLAAVATRP
jgi:uncharacterized membrane protein